MTDTAYRRILLVRIFPKPCSRYPKTVRLANHALPDKPGLSISESHHFGQAATRYHVRCFGGWWLRRGRDGRGEKHPDGKISGADVFP